MRERLIPLVLTGVVLLPVLAAAGDLEVGKKIYGQKCASCHGADGRGNEKWARAVKATVPDLTASRTSDAELLRILSQGKGRMPGYSKSIGKDELDAVFDYTKSLSR